MWAIVEIMTHGNQTDLMQEHAVGTTQLLNNWRYASWHEGVDDLLQPPATSCSARGRNREFDSMRLQRMTVFSRVKFLSLADVMSYPASPS